MFLIVDIALNHLGATDDNITNSALAAKAGGQLLFQEEADNHPSCAVDYDDDGSIKKW